MSDSYVITIRETCYKYINDGMIILNNLDINPNESRLFEGSLFLVKDQFDPLPISRKTNPKLW